MFSKHLQNFFLFLLLVSINLNVSASDTADNRKPAALILFHVVQDQFSFDYKDIKSATIIEHNYQFEGLRLRLKPYAVESFKRITGAGIGKVALLSINNKILSSSTIQTPLGGDILIKSITRGEAQDIINQLKSIQAQNELNSNNE